MRNKADNKFDLEIRSLLADAEEEVPQHVWDAVSSRIESSRRPVAWMRWAVGAVAAAAVAAAVCILPGTFRDDSSVISNLTAQSTIVAETPEVIAPVQEPVSETEEMQSAVQMPSVKPASTRKTVASQPAAEPEQEVSAPASEPTGDSAVEKTPSQTSVSEPSEAGSGRQVKKQEAWVDPFAVLDYQDRMNRKNPVRVDLKGIVGTNDPTKTKAASGAFAAPVKNGEGKTGISETSSSIYGVPVSFGVGVTIPLGGRWSAGTGVNYSLLTRTFSGSVYEPADGGVAKTLESDNIKNNIQYIGVPLNLFFDIISNEKVGLYTFAGGEVEKGISNKFLVPSSGNTRTFDGGISGLQWSAAVGLGVQFNMTDKLGLYIDPSARYYFDCGQPSSIRTQQPLMFNLEAGIRFNL